MDRYTRLASSTRLTCSYSKPSHGFYYFVPRDGDAQELDVSRVSWANIGQRVGNLPPNVLLRLDTCDAAAVGERIALLRSDAVAPPTMLRATRAVL